MEAALTRRKGRKRERREPFATLVFRSERPRISRRRKKRLKTAYLKIIYVVALHKNPLVRWSRARRLRVLFSPVAPGTP